MGKSIKAEMVPLVKQPVDVILAAARAAGRVAFTTRATIEDHCDAVANDWFNKVMPSSLGVMDDDAFGDLVRKTMAAFDEGVEQHLSNATATVTPVDISSVALRCEQNFHVIAALHDLCADAIIDQTDDPMTLFVLLREALRGLARDMENCSEVLDNDRGGLGYFNAHFGSI